jgi:Na+-driven multidrug efflux pump
LLGVACNAFRGLVLIIPLSWLGGFLGGANGVIWGLFAANLISGLLIGFLVLRYAPLTAKEGGKR